MTAWSWTNLIVWFLTPWIGSILSPLVIGTSPTGWTEWHSRLKHPSAFKVPPAWMLPYLQMAMYLLMGLAGFLVIQIGNPHSGAMHVGITFHLIQLALQQVWTKTFFRFHRLWPSLAVSVLWAVATSVAMVSCALATTWSLFGYVPYSLYVGYATALTGMYAHSNPTEQSVAADNNSLGNKKEGEPLTNDYDDTTL